MKPPKEMRVFPIGEANDQFREYFVGQSYLNMISTAQVVIGQILLIMAGEGWYQEWGHEPRRLRAGEIVHIPAGVKHWHGAAADTWLQHLTIEVPGENCRTEWCEPVLNEEYESLEKGA